MNRLPSPIPASNPLLPSPRSANLNPASLADPLRQFITDPDRAWLAVRDERITAARLFERYVFLLAAIPPVSGTIGFSAFGHASLPEAVCYGLAAYVLNLIFLYGATYMAFLISPMFDGKLGLDESAKLVVYSFMPFFIAGFFFICPPVSFLALAGLYGLVLFYKGVPVVTGIPPRKQLTYFALNIVSWLVFAEIMRMSIFR